MNSFEFSTDALGVKGAFYDKDITIYVEGEDDPIFWTEILKLVDKSAYIEDVGGCNELDKYIAKIIEENAEFYVATDRDHRDFESTDHLDCEKILFTYGHSIENTMYKCNSINNIIIKYSKKVELDLVDEIQEILNVFEANVNDLLVYDITSKRLGRGIKVFGDSCHRFLKNRNSTELCLTKINVFIESIKEKFTEEEIAETRKLIDENPKQIWFLIKGHFITLLVINIIKKYVRQHRQKEITLGLDDVYSHTIYSMKNNYKDVDVIHLIKETDKIYYA